MNLIKLRSSYSKYTDSDFQTKAQQILQDMTGNTAFPSPSPTMAELGAAIDAYGLALVKAAELGRQNVAEKNKRRETLEFMLGQLALYVMHLSNGDTAILTSSGFDLVKDREPAVLANPGMVTLGNGLSSGELAASVFATKGVNAYQFQYSAGMPATEALWITKTSSRSKIVIAGLQPGVQYFVRVAVVGKGEQVAYSPVSSIYVQ
jgi:hypothetical protein